MKKLLSTAIIICTVFAATAQDYRSVDSLLCEIYRKDQCVRANFETVFTGKLPQDSVLKFVQTMHNTDQENQAVIYKLLDEQGWPDNLSPLANQAIFLVVDHGNITDQQKYFPLIEQQVKKGNLDKSSCMTLYDRILMHTGKKQIYGTQTVSYTDKQTGDQVFYLWPVENPSRLDSLRKAINLPPIEQYLEVFKQRGMHVIWDKELTIDEIQKKKTGL